MSVCNVGERQLVGDRQLGEFRLYLFHVGEDGLEVEVDRVYGPKSERGYQGVFSLTGEGFDLEYTGERVVPLNTVTNAAKSMVRRDIATGIYGI